MSKKVQILLLHIIASLGFLLMPVFVSPDFNTGVNLFHKVPFLNMLFQQILLLGFFYLNFYYLLPKLYFSNRKLIYAVLVIICCLAVHFVPDFLFPFPNPEMPNFGDNPNLGNIPPPRNTPPPGDPTFPRIGPKPGLPHFFFSFVDNGFLQFLMLLLLSYLLKLTMQFNQIEREKLDAEVSFLKAQINHHFLFNTLNSLYALTLRKSDEAPKAILKLSDMMRYITSECSKNFVPLKREFEYIINYIDLQKLRLSKSVKLDFEIDGKSENEQITPLLLITFIENAFKHGINTEEESPITIKIKLKDSKLTLFVKNSISKSEYNDNISTETGLSNTQKRLEHLYPDRHNLEIKEEGNTFSVLLKLSLDDKSDSS